MKLTILTLLSAMTVACASAPKPVVHHNDTLLTYQGEISWEQKVQQDHRQTEADQRRNEQLAYQQSVEKINTQFDNERLLLQGCIDNYGGKPNQQCFDMLKKFCQIDEFVDSRGKIWKKEYCEKSFLNYYNPNIKH